MLILDVAKHVGDLVPEDFRRYPVWTWCEDETEQGGFVCPIVFADRVVDDTEYDALFIVAELVLADGTRLEGEVSIAPYHKTAYSFSFFRGGECFGFGYTPVPGSESLQQLATWLQKSIAAITSVTYTTDYSYPDGVRISGTVDLRGWRQESTGT